MQPSGPHVSAQIVQNLLKNKVGTALVAELEQLLGADSVRVRNAQTSALEILIHYLQPLQKSCGKSGDQAHDHQIVDIWARAKSCAALHRDLADTKPGGDFDAKSAALNRGLRAALGATMLEAEKGIQDLGDLAALRWAYKLASSLCASADQEQLLADLP